MSWRFLWVFALARAAFAHIGSPDVFFEGTAGPYRLLVTIRPPAVIPGIAEIEIRSATPEVREIRITPLRLTGEGAKHPPTPDSVQRSKDDPRFFTGSLWLMTAGEWQVRVFADGPRGRGEVSVPVPAAATRMLDIQKGTGILLSALGLLLSIGAISIIGAAAREARLEPGIQAHQRDVRRARLLMSVTAVFVLVVLSLGGYWWTAEANDYARRIFKPPRMTATLETDGRLLLRTGPAAGGSFRADDFIPDHGHLMHMYVIRLPEMERVWHLHPEQIEAGLFGQNLPAMPAGRYQLFSDVVFRSGFPVTMTAQIDLPDLPGKPLSGDDSSGSGPPLSVSDADRSLAELAGGGRMVWERDASLLISQRPTFFRFRVEDPNGKSASHLEPYMGMAGHAAFVATDCSVFAHVHPSGTVPMASLALAVSNPHAMHMMRAQSELAPFVSFPYGFPKPGRYRMFVQVKRAGRVETGVFDARVEK